MQLNIVIDDQLLQQARSISNLTSEQEIIEEVLRNWVATQLKCQAPKNSAKTLLESDFIGCGEAEPTLSANYKQVFSCIVDEKYDYR
ncbi:type II toxin-antitoxin system VapB family antitoxin [Thioflexithrix psekupsensis]|uniref:DUF2191 domain-containing protein n=1 Tax=Thioflexithrix psekupsensis TaxID=1570016 RepID=A0A251X6X5_9GAMM|nr:type II toxin-antitoxin system VapB family antitoxin [Thioflexithrix psekupsensis]OUD13828.1 hypothetical protein TPSD3_05635 [Thioflexithrix psekupsensis]